MSKGRGSAFEMTIIVAMLLCMLVAQLEYVEAATYSVGGSKGWGFNTDKWPRGKHFRAGDILNFNYNPKFHNVVVVGKNGYANCRTQSGARVYRTGKDKISLSKGWSYFICNIPGHCESGMKIAIKAV